MVTGRVVRFDSARGYGFIAPDHGGEDVFLHVNDLLIPEHHVRAGLAVEFEIEEGERGLKASSVRFAPGAEAPRGGPSSSLPATVVSSAPALRAAPAGDMMCDVLSADEYTRDVTELLLDAVPSLTGDQIRLVRSAMLQFAKRHGWTEG
ncbi:MULTISPECIES: cold-shock protein [Streptomyces]|uniref:Cold shock domain-containing protein n=1 Tax=Streptomyces lycii TaxID=2654337 RepID=A0ABQ7FCY5_9ACTN|nr:MULTISPECIES: cold shock domain-containing protein [Streptomyces]KAF4406951.1 cold shock domain-containing protein [Streptomyces lycii]PGH47931.1 DNA-binding protein [Streptomyces sp. Ru87]